MKKSKLFAMMALGAILFAGSTVGLSSAAHAATFDPFATYKIVNQNSGKALDVEYNSTEASYRLHQWTYMGLASQQWKLKPSTDGYYYIINVNSGLAADASGSSNGSKVWQWYFDNRESEKWDIQPFGSSYKIASKLYGKVFDIEFNSTSDGGNVNLWQSLSGVNSQLWSIQAL
ncbi:RICIN domain-containing protein [Tumebacillus sp. ITR2]|uniref:RICIN domain-containing protein n=1 Tax=Tumebacillus amylolyticus TaxID=2801339 RepID=A0ABS1J4Z0_9BACL|nr:RICIN domain-containing protein [Tumebacillus amylolyticus]MBL0385265.1 RICIN domain-containing protein [Tumebacillus amylolyticus]